MARPVGVIKKKRTKQRNATVAHFLLTRFNLQRGGPPNLPDWLDKRIGLFEKYCLPSIKNQSRTDFHWLLFFEASTEKQMRPYLNKWLKSVPWIVPLWCDRFKGERMGQCAESVVKKLTGTKKYLLTSRLDNDDGLHPDTMQILRTHTKKYLATQEPPGGGIVFDFPVGLRYQTETKNLYLWRRPHSPFMSFLLRANQGKFRTVHSFPEGHGAVWKYAPVQFISEKPAWIQIIHDSNISNALGRGEKLIGNYEEFSFEQV